MHNNSEQTGERKTSDNFVDQISDKELYQLNNVVDRLAKPEIDGNKPPSWQDLSEEERKLLIQRYGTPNFINKDISVVDYTRGEGCRDNERALPDEVTDKNYGVLDRCLLVYSLYGNAPEIPPGEKLRVVPGSLTVGKNGVILLPDFFYTPSTSLRRGLIISQMNRNPRKDKSIKLSEEYEEGILETDNLVLTIYRNIGSSKIGMGDFVDVSVLHRQAMQELKIPYLETDPEKFLVRYRQSLAIAQYVEAKIHAIVEHSNLLLIREAFNNSGELWQVEVPESIQVVSGRDVETNKDIFLLRGDIEKQQGKLTAVKDPTWRYGEERRPFVFKLSVDGNKDRYLFLSQADSLRMSKVA